MKDLFIQAYQDNIQREGADDLLKWLQQTDFFEAPASTRFHLSRYGGLVEHSINVWQRLCNQDVGNAETIAICGLLHDVCKVGLYKTEMRNKKDEHGAWIQVPYYTVDDQLPYGHGEKSVYIISGFLKLTREESISIRWHMGGFDDAVKGGSYALSEAWRKYPLAVQLHIADLQAAYIDDERKTI